MKTLKVKDVMTKNVIMIKCTDTILNCAKLMKSHNIGFIPVVNKHFEPIGVITDRDIIINAICNNKDINSSVISIMNTNIIYCDKNDELSIAVTKMADNQIRRIIVLEKNTIKGVLSLSDLTKHKQSIIYVPELFKEISYDIQSSNLTTLFQDIGEIHKV